MGTLENAGGKREVQKTEFQDTVDKMETSLALQVNTLVNGIFKKVDE